MTTDLRESELLIRKATFRRLLQASSMAGVELDLLLNKLLDQIMPSQDEHCSKMNGLTKRQVMIASMLKLGMSVKEIAGELGIAESTTRTHIYRMRAILGLSDLLSLRQQRDPSSF